jgi:hypothetical protein
MARMFLSAASSPRTLDVRPDDTDSRDYVFAPTLTLLPEYVNPKGEIPLHVLDQKREGACVGFSLAAIINLSLGRRKLSQDCREARGPQSQNRIHKREKGSPVPVELSKEFVSPRMLYEMARRYDEWQGEHYEGSSLRGGMKGWHKHGVCSEKKWPINGKGPGRLTSSRRADAMTRPLGAYYRILDSDVGHLQAAIVEGDAVLASAWVHSGWAHRELEPARDHDALRLRRIPFRTDIRGLHAFALVGYGPEGFIVQNSWGTKWGSGGLAVLTYEDWFEHRQDAWVARPGPTTLDPDGKPRLYLVDFAGGTSDVEADMAGTSGVEGLKLNRDVLPYLINTGDRGELSSDGRLETPTKDLPAMADRVRMTPVNHGYREVVLYAHGGLVSEVSAAETSSRLWSLCRSHNLTAYFFLWETGWLESLLGMLRSSDDAAGPPTTVDVDRILRRRKGLFHRIMEDAFRAFGRKIAPIASAAWDEMKSRAEGAARSPRGERPGGGAALFTNELFDAMHRDPGAVPFRIHLFGHSAGSIYLAHLYQKRLRNLLSKSDGKVELGTIQFFAPALTIESARDAFFAEPEGERVDPSRFIVYTLKDAEEKGDWIAIYPGSILTYVANHLEHRKRRVPLLGIRKDFVKARERLGSPVLKDATLSTRHGDFDNPRHEIEAALKDLAESQNI